MIVFLARGAESADERSEEAAHGARKRCEKGRPALAMGGRREIPSGRHHPTLDDAAQSTLMRTLQKLQSRSVPSRPQRRFGRFAPKIDRFAAWRAAGASPGAACLRAASAFAACLMCTAQLRASSTAPVFGPSRAGAPIRRRGRG